MNKSDYGPPGRPLSQTLLLFLFLGVVVILLVIRFWPIGEPTPINLALPHGDIKAEPRPVVARGDLAEDEKTTIDIFRQRAPSVVNITSLAFARSRFTFNILKIPKGTGTGFVWDAKGRIVTNYHVIRDAQEINVTFSQQPAPKKAKVVGFDESKDLAVLEIDLPADSLSPIPLGASHNLQVGQKVYAIGNPFGLDHSLTTGIISALGREIESENGRPIKGVIQTDAAINPGNSGGPLLDSAGRLIGVTTAIISPSGAWSGIGFAIPVDEVNSVVTQLIRHGRVIRPILGIITAPDQWVRQRGVEGVLIAEVIPGGPAAKAGLRGTFRDDFDQLHWGDIIVAIGEQKIRSPNDLFAVLEKRKVGDQVKVSIIREGDQLEFQVVLAADINGARGPD